MNESPNQEQMNHLLESKCGASVPCLQSEFNDASYSHYRMILHFTKGFIRKLIKIATLFSALRNIIQFTKWWCADSFSRTYEFLKMNYRYA